MIAQCHSGFRARRGSRAEPAGRARLAVGITGCLVLFAGLAPIPVRADVGDSGLRIAIAPFDGEGERAAISAALSLRVARLGVDRLLAPGSFEIEPAFDPRADAVRRWASKADVDNIVVGRVERATGGAEAWQIEAAVRSGHSGAELFRHAVHVPVRAALEPALDQLAAAIVRDLGGESRGVERAASGVQAPPVSASAAAARPESGSATTRSGAGEMKTAQVAASAAGTDGDAAGGGARAKGTGGAGPKSGALDAHGALGEFDSDAPIEINADTAEIVAEGAGRRLVFTGSVRVRQADLTLQSDFLEAEYVEGESEPRQLVARGTVRVEQGNRSARCDHARYERASQQVSCRGHAELVQGCDIVRGELIVLDLAANKARVEGAASIVISPKQGADAQCKGAGQKP